MTSSSIDRFGRRVVQACLIGAAFVRGGLVLWRASALMLLIFAGILPAILLDGLSAALARRLPVPRAVPVVAIMLAIGGTRPRRLAPGDHLARPGCGWRTLADLRHRLERRIVVL